MVSVDASNLKLLILNAPCNGFGDIIFAYKLYQMLSYMYNAKVYIATSDPEKMLMLGNIPKRALITLTDNKGNHPGQCRRYARLILHSNIIFDLIFPAPIAIDFKFSLNDVKGLIPYAREDNVFAFSEYNDSLDKGMHFNTGLGKGRLGILLTEFKKSHTRPIEYPYAIAYIRDDDSAPNWNKCLVNFIEMITAKYRSKIFQLVISEGMINYFYSILTDTNEKLGMLRTTKMKESVRRRVHGFYDHVILISKTEDYENIDFNKLFKNKNIFIIRGDIFPVSNEKMINYIQHSVDDILITGDQSLTDVLSCCPEKNIWYQITPWKVNFAKNLSRVTKNEYLNKKTTSCGIVDYEKYPNYSEILTDYSFFKNFRPLMDDLIGYTVRKKKARDLLDMDSLCHNRRRSGRKMDISQNSMNIQRRRRSNMCMLSPGKIGKYPVSKIAKVCDSQHSLKGNKCFGGECQQVIKVLSSRSNYFGNVVVIKGDNNKNYIVKWNRYSEEKENTLREIKFQDAAASLKLAPVIYETYMHGKHFYIVMEYLNDKGFKSIFDHYIKDKVINKQYKDIIIPESVIIRIADACNILHASRISHGDLHPRNVFYNKRTNKVKFIDFGDAMIHKTPAKARENERYNFSQWYVSNKKILPSNWDSIIDHLR